MRNKMRHTVITVVILGSLVFAQHTRPGNEPPNNQSATSSRVVAFVNVQVIPMDREHILTHHTVIVRDGRIAELGPAGQVKVPEDAMRIDGRGQFLMPGLADMHVHISDEEFLLYLAAGVTTVRNMNGSPEHLQWREKIAKGEILSPTIYTTGPLVAGTPQRWKYKAIVNTAEEAERVVVEQKKAGYDFIKAYDGLSKESYEALSVTAKKEGIRVVGHIPKDVGLEGVLKSGQASIEHGEQLIYASFNPDLDPARIPVVADAARKAGIWVCPTLAVIESFALQVTNREALLSRPEMKYVSPATLEWWKSNTFRGSFNKMMAYFNRKLVRGLKEAGVKILAGTDNPNPMMVPGFSLHDELRALVAAGLTPYEALEAATRGAAEFVGGDFGTIAVGKRADLILLDDNPLEDVTNASRRVGVMVRGRWFAAAELRKMLDNLAATFADKK